MVALQGWVEVACDGCGLVVVFEKLGLLGDVRLLCGRKPNLSPGFVRERNKSAQLGAVQAGLLYCCVKPAPHQTFCKAELLTSEKSDSDGQDKVGLRGCLASVRSLPRNPTAVLLVVSLHSRCAAWCYFLRGAGQRCRGWGDGMLLLCLLAMT